MFKKALLASFVITGMLASPIPANTNNKPLNEDNLPKYTEEYIHTLFGTHRDNPREVREYINQVKTKANDCTKSNCEFYAWFIFPTGTYSRECVEHAVRTAALNQIVEDGHDLGYQYTHSPATLTFIEECLRDEILQLYQTSQDENGRFKLNGTLRNYRGEKLNDRVLNFKNSYDARVKKMNEILDEAIAFGYGYTDEEATVKFIKDTLENEIKELIQKPNNPNPILRNYHGDVLKKRVSDIKKEYDQRRPKPSIKTYPSENCCSCLESFNEVTRVFLTPCGHDICKDCANEWFKRNNTCPHCRAVVTGQIS